MKLAGQFTWLVPFDPSRANEEGTGVPFTKVVVVEGFRHGLHRLQGEPLMDLLSRPRPPSVTGLEVPTLGWLRRLFSLGTVCS